MGVADASNQPRATEATSSRLANTLLQRLSRPPASATRPALVMMSGLPGTGKSYLARLLAARLPVVIVETDWVRKSIYAHPTYSAKESFVVYQLAYRLIEAILAEGQRVIFDATNMRERSRRVVYDIAEKVGAVLVIVHVVAPPSLVRERMERRQQFPVPGELSDADWSVYQRFAAQEEAIRRPHVEVDTSQPLEDAVEEIIRRMEAG